MVPNEMESHVHARTFEIAAPTRRSRSKSAVAVISTAALALTGVALAPMSALADDPELAVLTVDDDYVGTPGDGGWYSNIEDAVAAALADGARIVVKPGTYTGTNMQGTTQTLRIPKAGSLNKTLILESEVEGAAIINVPVIIKDSAATRTGEFVLDGFTIGGVKGAPIDSDYGIWHDNYSNALQPERPQTSIINNTVQYLHSNKNHVEGIFSGDSSKYGSNILIAGNLITNISSDEKRAAGIGINAKAMTNLVIENNTVRTVHSDAVPGIGIETRPSNPDNPVEATVRNNVAWDGVVVGLNLSEQTVASNNEVNSAASKSSTVTAKQVKKHSYALIAGWHSASNTADPGPDGWQEPTFVANGVVLHTNQQLLHGFAESAAPTDLMTVVRSGIGWNTSSADVTFQIPVFWGESGFTTLRTTSKVGDNHVFSDQTWTSSRAIAGTAIGQNGVASLAEMVAAIEDASDGAYRVGGFGVRSGEAPGSTVSTIRWGDTVYEFTLEKMTVGVTITGTVKVGEVLTANPTADVSGVTFTYQWLRDGKSISKAKSSTYTVSTSDSGKRLSVKVKASKSGLKSVSKTSAKTAKVIKGDFEFTGLPTITGDLAVGKTLKVDTKTASPSPASTSHSYQWYRNGAAIKNATKSSYKLVVADEGALISVRVTYKKSAYNSTQLFSAETTAIDKGTITTKGTLVISGTSKVGKTLTAKGIKWSPSTSLVKRYYWYADGDLVQVSTSSKFKVTFLESGKEISVEVKVDRKGYYQLTTPGTTTKLIP